MSRITSDLIKQGMSDAGGWNREQIELLGVEWPPSKGWKRRVIGNDILPHDASRFIALKGGSKSQGKKMRHWLKADGAQGQGLLKPVDQREGVILWGHCKGQPIEDQSDEALRGAVWASEKGVGDANYLTALRCEQDRRQRSGLGDVDSEFHQIARTF